MAQRLQLIDDIDGTNASETVAFSLDGVNYEIDLNESHASELRSTIEAWINNARRVGGRRTISKAATSAGSSADMRNWAIENGFQVSSRGRVSAEIREAYEQAHK